MKLGLIELVIGISSHSSCYLLVRICLIWGFKSVYGILKRLSGIMSRADLAIVVFLVSYMARNPAEYNFFFLRVMEFREFRRGLSTFWLLIDESTEKELNG